MAEAEKTGGFTGRTGCIRDLEPGDWAIFDPFYGVEEIRKVKTTDVHWPVGTTTPDEMPLLGLTVMRRFPGLEPTPVFLPRHPDEGVVIWNQGEHTTPNYKLLVEQATTTALAQLEMFGDASAYPAVAALERIRDEAGLEPREVSYETELIEVPKGVARALKRVL